MVNQRLCTLVTSLLLAHGTHLAAAQQVLTLPLIGYDSQDIAASVVAVQDSATTLALACGTGSDGETADCGVALQLSLIYGPSTYHVDGADNPGFTFTQDCTFSGTTAAACAESFGGSEANFPGATSTTYSGSDIVNLAVTVTAGADLLSGGASSGATTTAAPGSTGSSAASATAAAFPTGTAATVTSQGSSAAASTETGSTAAASTSGASAASGSGMVSGSGTTSAAAASSSGTAAGGSAMLPGLCVGAVGIAALLCGVAL